jgi:hypothetical protein
MAKNQFQALAVIRTSFGGADKGILRWSGSVE